MVRTVNKVRAAGDVLANLQQSGVTVRLERRTWYVDGKYLGEASPFLPVGVDELAAELTGDFYGEWQGRRHVDGEAVLRADLERAIDYRIAVCGRVAHHGAMTHYPVRLSDYGEYRVVTDDSEHARSIGVAV